MQQYEKLLKRIGNILLSCFGAWLIIINLPVEYQAVRHNFSDLEALPHRPAGLVVGNINTKSSNPRYDNFTIHSLEAAATLLEAGKIDRIIVSGNGQTSGASHPDVMKMRLLRLGVPDESIIVDYNGDNAITSIRNAKEIHNCDSLTIITQRLYSGRALSIAAINGIDAVSYSASGNNKKAPRIKTRLANEIMTRALLPFALLTK